MTPGRAADLVIPDGTSLPLQGARLYTKVTIDGELRVFEQAASPPFYLHLKAEEITIGATGRIDADLRGFQGTPSSGAGPAPGGTPPQVVMNLVAPGGGGAHSGNGGSGFSSTCVAFLGAEGGFAYDLMPQIYDTDPAMLVGQFAPMNLAYGSSGGASNSGPPNDNTGRGGHGGGAIILEASRITLNGTIGEFTIHANGENGSAILGEATGGGGGGLVWIRSPGFTFGAGASIAAIGGTGGAGNSLAGSGGGGLVILAVNGDTTTLPVDVSGGPAVGACPGTAGAVGLANRSLSPPGCIDADNDSADSDLCGGTDCDDGEVGINPMAIEVCDNIDNDCDGTIDLEDTDPETQLCPPGQNTVCVMGACVSSDGGVVTDAAENPRDDVLVRGGLCTAGAPVRLSAVRVLGPLAWLSAALAALALWRRRR